MDEASLDVDDITPYNQDFDFDSQIKKLKLFKFPFTGEGKDRRSFQLKWIQEFPWIEYSVSRDAAFCYVCRKFAFGNTSNNCDTTFTIKGFDSWKNALGENKGFRKHQNSKTHTNAAKCFKERVQRDQEDTSISNLVNSTVLMKRRYYMCGIINVIKFLSQHQLAFRGDWDDENGEEKGIFNALFEYACTNDSELANCRKFIPSNATYKSPLIQNEIIDILAVLVRSKIVREMKNADVNCFSILFDGTKDKNTNEIISLASRFVSGGKVFEALLFLEATDDEDADAFTKLLLKSIKTYHLDANNILSQCYDGAPVMNGYKSGVAKRLQDELNKVIPYIHCFNHRLHLVVIHLVSRIASVAEFFDQLKLIFTTFRKPKVRKLYDGHSLKRLLETRWSGHYNSVKSLKSNYKDVISTLNKIKNDIDVDICGDDKAICFGILEVISKKEFVFLLLFLDEILSVIKPADTIFQKRDIGYKRAMPVLEAVISSVREYRTDEKYAECLKNTDDFIDQNTSTNPLLSSRPIRNRQRSTLLRAFAIEDTLGERSSPDVNMKSTYYEIIDIILLEFHERFSENNKVLLALSSADNFDVCELQPLEDLGIKLPSKCELRTAHKYVNSKKTEHQKINDARKAKEEEELPRFNLLRTLFEVRESFPEVYDLYAKIEIFPCSTSICECSFSSLSRIDIPSRFSMSNKRLRNLAFLAFEHKRLVGVDPLDVLKVFDSKKDRKLQLF